jgi:type IV pilus secretin PilQ/predicted competence protein
MDLVRRISRSAWVTLLALCLLLPALPFGATAASAGKTVTLDSVDAYLPSVLKILAEQGDLNIITGPGVSATRISIHMKDVPIDQAVNLVVRAAGLAYERIGNSILVADSKSLKEETGLTSYVVTLKFADASDVKEAIKNIAGDVQVDKGGNRLIVVTSPRIISEIQEIVSVMDVPARQVMLEARIVEVSTSAARKLGIDWDKLASQSFVIVEGAPHGRAPYGGIPDSVNWFPNPPSGNLLQSHGLYRQEYAWATALDLLIHDGNARVLASPKIATLNGHEASILIGSRVPFVVTGTVLAGAGGASGFQQIQREEVGIKLHITPLINADGYITTDIKPEVSSITSFVGANSDLPVVATRQASTTVRLKDGNTVIIGGLLSEDKTTGITKVPILGDIPGLGVFFQHRDVSANKTDLVIEVTPRILPEQQ